MSVFSNVWQYRCADRASAIPYVLGSVAFGWETIVPIYFAIYIYKSKNRPFYYPGPRAIDLRVAKKLSPGLFVAYLAPILLALREQHTQSTVASWFISTAHVSLPVLVILGKSFSKGGPSTSNIAESVYGTLDMPYLSQFYNMLLILTSTLHFALCGQIMQQVTNIGFGYEIAHLACLALAITVWCCFTVWDLRRTNITHAFLPGSFIWVLLGVIFLGPAATLIGLWKVREVAWEASRMKKS